ncbi:MAG: hypothetical protein JRI89_09700 [Deltaproteobacteria bacterium]|nr:hypothetical protein [Deltaproteobacteria bacterium]
MKKGIIVYLTDSGNLPESFSVEEAMAGLGLPGDSTVLAAGTEGFYDVEDACHLLLTQGAQHVSCVKARLNEAGKLEIFGDPLRLYG